MSLTKSKKLAIHLAEYQMLTTRSTYRLTLHYALWPILLLSLTFFAAAKDYFGPKGIIWCGTTVLQLCVINYYDSLSEIFTDVKYIETILRPKIKEMFGEKGSFWLYEHFLLKRRGKGILFAEFWPSCLALVALIYSAYYCNRNVEWQIGDTVGIILNLILVSKNILSARQMSQQRISMLGKENLQSEIP